jgi:molybdopterin/thiamine biosynthesis adenylyltransferase
MISRDELDRRAQDRAFPDGTPFRGISVADVIDLSRAHAASGRDVEAAALEAGIVPERYARNMRTFSPADQAALLGAHAAVIGLGGLGGTVVEILARLGVGRLTLLDGDRFEDSNLNRQLLSTVPDLGLPKAEVARQRVERINPSVEVAAHARFLTAENAAEMLAGCGVVVDCLDNLPARFVVEDACRSAGVPMVSAAVAGASGHLTTIFPGDRGLRLIYGDPAKAPRKGAETALGTVPHCVVCMASLECAEVVKILLHTGNPLRDRLLLADLTEGLIEVMNLR